MKILKLAIGALLVFAGLVLFFGDFVVGATIIGLPAAIVGDILGGIVAGIGLLAMYSGIK